MSETDSPSVIRRKAGHGRGPAEIGRMTPARALRVATSKAAEVAAGLNAAVTTLEERRSSLAALAADLPEPALLILTEGPFGSYGLAALDAQALAALVEMQTTGRVAPRPTEPRPPTRTDAALAADFVDRLLEEFETRTAEAGLDVAQTVAGYRYALALADPKALTMTLEEQPYRLYQLGLDLGDGAKTGRMVLVFPGRPPRPAPPGDGGAQWQDALEEVVSEAQITLSAILARHEMPLGAVAGLAPGARIVLPREALGLVRIEGLDGEAVMQGQLGQQAGFRAVRLHAAPPDAAPAPAMTPPEPDGGPDGQEIPEPGASLGIADLADLSE